MKKKLGFILIAAILSCLVASMALAVDTMYVYTQSGAPLRVRERPSTDARILGRLNYGEAVEVESISGGWAHIIYGSSGSAYVASRYLVSSQPAARDSSTSSSSSSSGSSSSVPSSSSGSGASSGTGLSGVNAQYRSMMPVTPYTVYVRPSKPSGYVNFRWAPSSETEAIDHLYQGYELTVLAKGSQWLQVEDERTGRVGYIYTKYTSDFN